MKDNILLNKKNNNRKVMTIYQLIIFENLRSNIKEFFDLSLKIFTIVAFLLHVTAVLRIQHNLVCKINCISMPINVQSPTHLKKLDKKSLQSRI